MDVCKVYGEDTAFLQQAANITGGVYVKVTEPQALLQYLMVRRNLDGFAASESKR